MPITKSAKKSLKVSRTKAAANYKREVLLSKALKKVNKDNVNEAIALIDKAAKTNIIHANKAARLKSRLTKKYGSPKSTKVKTENAKVKATVKKTKEVKKTEVKTKSAKVKTPAKKKK